MPYVNEVVARKVGGRAFFDTLAAVVGQAVVVDAMPDWKRGRLFGWAPRDSDGKTIAVYLTLEHKHKWVEYALGVRIERVTTATVSKELVRGIAAHEFGHVLETTRPELYERFKSLGPAKPFTEQMNSELFADAFAVVMVKRLPETMYVPYLYFQAFVTKEQRGLVESYVKDNWR